MRDPYGYGPLIGEVDLHLFAEGQHWQIYEKFGAHLRTIGDTTGVHFVVWAPNAQRVSVVGDFNGWDGRVNPMRKLIGGGVWEVFLPGLQEGAPRRRSEQMVPPPTERNGNDPADSAIERHKRHERIFRNPVDGKLGPMLADVGDE